MTFPGGCQLSHPLRRFPQFNQQLKNKEEIRLSSQHHFSFQIFLLLGQTLAKLEAKSNKTFVPLITADQIKCQCCESLVDRNVDV